MRHQQCTFGIIFTTSYNAQCIVSMAVLLHATHQDWCNRQFLASFDVPSQAMQMQMQMRAVNGCAHCIGDIVNPH